MLNIILTQTHGLSLLQVPEAVQVSICQTKYICKHMCSVLLQVPEAVQVSIC